MGACACSNGSAPGAAPAPGPGAGGLGAAACAPGASVAAPGAPSAGAPGVLSLIAVGDNIAHGNILAGAWRPGSRSFDFSPLFSHVAARLKSYDLAAVCQESVLVADPARRSSYPFFATPQTMGDALAAAGFDVVLGATNHAGDQGAPALAETCAFWEREHPDVALLGLHARREDAGQGAVVERAGMRVALFDCAYGLNRGLPAGEAWRVDVLAGGGEARLLDGVARARREADFVVCFLHVGEEYRSAPTEAQALLAARLIDAGAGAVVCSHAHVMGPWGLVRTAAGNEGAVFFGLGNFVSGQRRGAGDVLGGAAGLRLERGADGRVRLASFGLAPLVCHTDARDGSVAAYFLDDYTDELVARHVLSTPEAPFSVAGLRSLVPRRDEGMPTFLV